MSEYIERESELENEYEYESLLKKGYEIIHNGGEKYLYDPTHWKISNDGFHDYEFDDLFFESLTNLAKDLAMSEGY